jgi:hypothetical protein
MRATVKPNIRRKIARKLKQVINECDHAGCHL